LTYSELALSHRIKTQKENIKYILRNKKISTASQPFNFHRRKHLWFDSTGLRPYNEGGMKYSHSI